MCHYILIIIIMGSKSKTAILYPYNGYIFLYTKINISIFFSFLQNLVIFLWIHHLFGIYRSYNIINCAVKFMQLELNPKSLRVAQTPTRFWSYWVQRRQIHLLQWFHKETSPQRALIHVKRIYSQEQWWQKKIRMVSVASVSNLIQWLPLWAR